ncbi:MAG: hypothetical protein QW815_07055, partial [Nitrososphaerota archaeon]
DLSPAAVCVLLHTSYDKIPDWMQALVKVGVESGAALAGYLQTENIGIEKMVCNVVANPNIRYLIVCGVESMGHQPGQTLQALVDNGVDEKRRIIGAEAPTPYLYNIPLEGIERFRKQITLVNLALLEDVMLARKPDVIREVVRCCYQEEPTQFLRWTLYDPGAFPEAPLCFKITWRIEKPWTLYSEEEEKIVKRVLEAAKRIEDEERAKRRRKEDEELLRLLGVKNNKDR